jgi:RNA polymerase sigma-70 factor (ECF subfamily)
MIPTTRTSPVTVQAQGNLSQYADQELARLARKDGHAFSELYRRHFKHVYGYHLLRTNNIDDAQDLTSQTFMAALESIHRYDGRGSFAAWLMGIAHHKMAQHFRGKRPDMDLDAHENLPHPLANPEDVAYRRGLLGHVREAMRLITPERAEAFVLRTFGGLSAAETADVMGKSEGAIKMLAHRALRDLRQILDADFHLEEE